MSVFISGILTFNPQNSKVTPIIMNSRTMLPIRFVAESIGAYVGWFASDKSILIVYPKK